MSTACDGRGLILYALATIFNWKLTYEEWCGCDMCKYMMEEKGMKVK